MPDPTSDAVRKYIVENLLDGDERGLEMETDLVASGLLDSFAVVQMLTFIEEEFQIEVPRGKINTSHFRSIRTVAQLVEETRALGAS